MGGGLQLYLRVVKLSPPLILNNKMPVKSSIPPYLIFSDALDHHQFSGAIAHHSFLFPTTESHTMSDDNDHDSATPTPNFFSLKDWILRGRMEIPLS
jgi:hypothetical protein